MTGKTILVADDEAHMTYILGFKLRQMGVTVLTCGSGGEALELARAHQPDLVITDHKMPGMNGLELSLQLRQDPLTREIPVVMLTGLGHQLDPATIAETNIRHLLPKPFSTCELMDKIGEVLNGVVSAALADMVVP
jgi:two-component system phosphate regulon response regulator PhoB